MRLGLHLELGATLAIVGRWPVVVTHFEIAPHLATPYLYRWLLLAVFHYHLRHRPIVRWLERKATTCGTRYGWAHRRSPTAHCTRQLILLHIAQDVHFCEARLLFSLIPTITVL